MYIVYVPNDVTGIYTGRIQQQSSSTHPVSVLIHPINRYKFLGHRLCCDEANYYAVGFAVCSKSTFRYVRVSFCPEHVGNWSSSPQNDLELSPRSIQSCFPLLQGPSCRKSPSALFRSNPGSNTITIVHRTEKRKKRVFRSDRVL